VHAAVLPFPEEVVEGGLNEGFVGAVSEAQEHLDFSATNATEVDDCNRGDFRTISTGISHGGGHGMPKLSSSFRDLRRLSVLQGGRAVRSMCPYSIVSLK
jgi:hypothetical protein